MSNWIYWKCCYFLKHKSWPSDVPLSNKEMSLRVDLTQDPIHLVIFRVDGNQDVRELDNQVAHSRSCVTDNRSTSVRVCAQLCQCRPIFNQIIITCDCIKVTRIFVFWYLNDPQTFEHAIYEQDIRLLVSTCWIGSYRPNTRPVSSSNRTHHTT